MQTVDIWQDIHQIANILWICHVTVLPEMSNLQPYVMVEKANISEWWEITVIQIKGTHEWLNNKDEKPKI